jgi:hypothetical protein
MIKSSHDASRHAEMAGPADRRDHANRVTLTHPVRPEAGTQGTQGSTALPYSSSTTRPLKGGPMEPFADHDGIDHDESPVHYWRVSGMPAASSDDAHYMKTIT